MLIEGTEMTAEEIALEELCDDTDSGIVIDDDAVDWITTNETVLEELRETGNPGATVDALGIEAPTFVKEAWLVGMARGTVLGDVEAVSARLVAGTLKDDTLDLLLLLDTIELPTIELLLSETGTPKMDEVAVELGGILDDARWTDESTTSCEEEITDPTVERGTASDVLPLEKPTVLEATAD